MAITVSDLCLDFSAGKDDLPTQFRIFFFFFFVNVDCDLHKLRLENSALKGSRRVSAWQVCGN